MRALHITSEMQKYQDQARRIWQDRKAVDASKVVLGWNLRKGTVIIDTAKGAEIELNADPAFYSDAEAIDITMTVNGESKSGKMAKTMIAKIILVQPCEVYYSR